MHKRLALIILVLTQSVSLFAQDMASNNTNTTPAVIKPARDFVMLQFNYTNWFVKPDSVKTKTFGYSFNSYLCYDFPIKKTNLSFAAGLGVNVSVTYLDGQIIKRDDSSAAGSIAQFKPDTADYKKYKFVTAYITAPFELRYFANKTNRNKGFKAAIGVEVGALVGAHTKGLRDVDGTAVNDKEDTKRFVSPWNFAGTLRLGWGNFSIFGSYNLTNVFKENEGPVITPLSVGICLTGL